jgi:hypothetical protein
MMTALARRIADWVSCVTFDDLPADVVDATRWRILDVIGLAYAGAETTFGRSTIAAAIEISPPGPCRIIGTGDRVGVTIAAFANAALPPALEFDDTHNESIVHMSSPAVAASLALAETRPISGRDLILAIAIANDSPYGLAAGVWTTSIKRAIRSSERLQAGSVWVNTYRAVSYMSPFGGYKRSGLGRENGQDAIWGYLQTKSVWISTADTVANPFVMR